jgi:RNA polymerase sigma-70 factor (ECF subfamily)
LQSVTFFALRDTLVAVSGFLADAEAFSYFYRGNARSVLVFFARRTIDAEAALDLTGETFAAAFASRRSFRGATDGEASAWLFVIARRQLARYFEAGTVSRELVRRLGVEMPEATEVELERIETLAGLGALRVALREQLRELDAGQREALWLRVVDEQPYTVVAARLGISEQAARARVSRALRGLAEPLAALAVTMKEER